MDNKIERVLDNGLIYTVIAFACIFFISILAYGMKILPVDFLEKIIYGAVMQACLFWLLLRSWAYRQQKVLDANIKLDRELGIEL